MQKQWAVSKGATADKILSAIAAGQCTTDAEVERIARKCGDKVFWFPMQVPTRELEPMQTPRPRLTVDTILQELGMTRNLSGCSYLEEAIKVAGELPPGGLQGKITSVIYTAVAERYDTTACRVERAIRHSIEKVFMQCPLDVITKYFGNAYSPDRGKPTNGEFIAGVVHLLQEGNI